MLTQTAADWFCHVADVNDPAEYVENMLQPGQHADHIDLAALARYLGRAIRILHPDGSSVTLDPTVYSGTPYTITVGVQQQQQQDLHIPSTGFAGPAIVLGYLPEVDDHAGLRAPNFEAADEDDEFDTADADAQEDKVDDLGVPVSVSFVTPF